jgi:BMFP domain-containing protein YqiC
MQSENRFFDDLVKVMNGAAGTLAGVTREAEAGMRERMREWVGGLDMVGREEFEAVKAIAVAAREENQQLKARLDAFEATPAGAPKTGTPRAKKNPSGAAQ